MSGASPVSRDNGGTRQDKTTCLPVGRNGPAITLPISMDRRPFFIEKLPRRASSQDYLPNIRHKTLQSQATHQ